MVSYTPFLNLAKPADGESNWGSHINADLDILDEAFNDIADSFDNINIVKLGGYPINLGSGVASTGTARLDIAEDDLLTSKIITNTGNQVTSSTSIASVFSTPLGLKVLDDLDLQIGIDSRGLSIYNPEVNSVITPLYGYLTSITGSYWDTGSGNVTPNTVRNVHASDDLATLSVESIDDEFGASLTTATLPNSEVLKIGNVVLRDVCGIFTGVIDKPLYTSLVQGADPLVFDFGSGNYSSNTLRTVSSTNDPNLSAIKTASETLASSTNQSGYTSPTTTLLGGRTIIRRGVPTGIPGFGIDTEIIRPLLGNDKGLYTHVSGGLVNAIIKNDINETIATKQSALFYRNPDIFLDRGQVSSKPFFNAITNPLVIGNGVNIVQLGGYAISRMRGTIGEGTQRVCIADDDTNLSRIVVLLDIIISLLDIIIEDEKPTYVVVSSVYGGSGIIAPPAMIVEEGDAATFYMVPAVGWQINAIRLDGIIQGTRSNMFVVPNVKADRTVSVEFTELPEITHTIIASSGAHGSIVPAGTITVGDGDNYTFNFVSDNGYRIDKVLVDGVEISPDTYSNSFTFNNIVADHSISVSYEAIPITTYTITSSASGNGTVSPTGISVYNAGSSATYYVAPMSGYSITSVMVDGSSVGAVSSYIFQNIYANHTISASFGQNQYLIDTSVVGGNGSITPSKVATLGETVVVSFFPNSGYKLKTVTVDNAVVSVSTNSYTFSNISGPHRIVVVFEAIPQNTYKITAWMTGAAGSGSISPSGDSFVTQGGSKTYTTSSNQPYYLKKILVDGVEVAGDTYTFSNVNSNHTIEAIFKRKYTLTTTCKERTTICPPVGVHEYEEGTEVLVSGTYLAGEWQVLYFSNDGINWGNPIVGSANTCGPITCVMDKNKFAHAGDRTIYRNITFNYSENIDIWQVYDGSSIIGWNSNDHATTDVCSLPHGSSAIFEVVRRNPLTRSFSPGYLAIDGIEMSCPSGRFTIDNITSDHVVDVEEMSRIPPHSLKLIVSGGFGGPGTDAWGTVTVRDTTTDTVICTQELIGSVTVSIPHGHTVYISARSDPSRALHHMWLDGYTKYNGSGSGAASSYGFYIPDVSSNHEAIVYFKERTNSH